MADSTFFRVQSLLVCKINLVMFHVRVWSYHFQEGRYVMFKCDSTLTSSHSVTSKENAGGTATGAADLYEIEEDLGDAVELLRFSTSVAEEAGARVASGVYLYRMQAGQFGAARKLLLMK